MRFSLSSQDIVIVAGYCHSRRILSFSPDIVIVAEYRHPRECGDLVDVTKFFIKTMVLASFSEFQRDSRCLGNDGIGGNDGGCISE